MTKLISLGQASLLTKGTLQVKPDGTQNPILLSPRQYCHLETGTVDCIANGRTVCQPGCVTTP